MDASSQAANNTKHETEFLFASGMWTKTMQPVRHNKTDGWNTQYALSPHLGVRNAGRRRLLRSKYTRLASLSWRGRHLEDVPSYVEHFLREEQRPYNNKS